jgi:hypothetical protein
MTQRFPFVSSNTVAPSFQPVLDGVQHLVVVTWNVSAQRFYINVYANDGALVCAVPLVGSSPGIELASVVWDANRRAAIAELTRPFWRPLGQIIVYTIQDCQPDAFNGLFNCLTESPTSFSYPMIANPGQIKVLGSANRCLNMIGPWFTTSSMIFRNNAFEVNP